MDGMGLEAVRAAEARAGVHLPDDYRAFVAEHNQWHPPLNKDWVTAIRAGERRKGMNVHLYPFFWEGNDEEGNSVDMGVLGHFREEFEVFLPEGALTIGACAGDVEVVLFYEGERRGQVWLKIMAECEGEADERDSGMYFSAPSFTDFVSLVGAEPPEAMKYLDEP